MWLQNIAVRGPTPRITQLPRRASSFCRGLVPKPLHFVTSTFAPKQYCSCTNLYWHSLKQVLIYVFFSFFPASKMVFNRVFPISLHFLSYITKIAVKGENALLLKNKKRNKYVHCPKILKILLI